MARARDLLRGTKWLESAIQMHDFCALIPATMNRHKTSSIPGSVGSRSGLSTPLIEDSIHRFDEQNARAVRAIQLSLVTR